MEGPSYCFGMKKETMRLRRRAISLTHLHFRAAGLSYRVLGHHLHHSNKKPPNHTAMARNPSPSNNRAGCKLRAGPNKRQTPRGIHETTTQKPNHKKREDRRKKYSTFDFRYDPYKGFESHKHRTGGEGVSARKHAL